MGLWDPSRASCKVAAPSLEGQQGLGGDLGGCWGRCMPGRGLQQDWVRAPGREVHLATPAWGKCWDFEEGCPHVAFLDGSPWLSWVRTSPHHAGKTMPRAPAISPGMETLAATFSSIAGAHSHLEGLQSNYSQRLANLRDNLNQTLQQCGHPCGSVSLDGLTFSVNFSRVRRGRARGQGPPRSPFPVPPQPPHPRLFPTDPQCGEAAEGTG